MTLEQKVGQLLMVDCPSGGASQAALAEIRSYHVGSIILDGNSTLGVQRTAAISAQLQRAAPPGVGLLISTDQEGGYVQRMRGPGFSDLPRGVQQGTMDPAALRTDARTWGQQLKAAGINVDLAPVLDVVPPGVTVNPPIGDLDRQYGSDPGTVTAHGLAFAQGLREAGVAPTVKHFPGLGRVAGNTDTASGVLDTVTTRHDPLIAPFAAAVRGGVPLVMMSTAIYPRIDPDRPAAFSRTIVTGMLRGDLGFNGVVISDDVGGARQVSGYSVADRALLFVAAGGDIVLTVVPGQAGTMTAALIARAQADPAFARLVDAAALRVLTLKQALGLLR
jgi:beta-N-acetylhexosaminidase